MCVKLLHMCRVALNRIAMWSRFVVMESQPSTTSVESASSNTQQPQKESLHF